MAPLGKVTHIVVHYSATYGDQNLDVTDIDAMHKARGWKGVGYHFVITRNGVVQRGRPENRLGAHVKNQNTGKIGICWIGGLDRASGNNVGVDNRTEAQKKALIKLIKELLERYPGAKVVGHRDLAATQCPGFNVQPWWDKVRLEDAPAKTPVSPEDEEYVGFFKALYLFIKEWFRVRS